MIGAATNALFRLRVQDPAPQAAAVRKRLTALDDVAEEVLLNDIVVVETSWIPVLLSAHRCSALDAHGGWCATAVVSQPHA